MLARCLTAILSVILLWCAPSLAHQEGGDATSKCLSGCEADLDNDGRQDIILVVDSPNGRELVALMRTQGGYQAYRVARDVGGMALACRKGKTLTQTKALPGGRRTHATPGAYISLKQPEGAAVAYYWNGKGFTEVWTAD